MSEQKKRKSFLEKLKDEAYENWYSVSQVFNILIISMLFMFTTFLASYYFSMIKYNTINTFYNWTMLLGIILYSIFYVSLMVRMFKLKRRFRKELDEKVIELKAERDVAETLKSLDPKTYYTYNGLSLGFGDIDHIVVGPTGVFVIETKANRGVLGVNESGYLTVEDGDTPHKDYRRQSMGNGMQLRYFLNEHVREINPYVTIFLCFPYAEINKGINLTSKKDNFVIPCLTKEQVVQRIYRTEGNALNTEKILAIKRALDEWEEGMDEEE